MGEGAREEGSEKNVSHTPVPHRSFFILGSAFAWLNILFYEPQIKRKNSHTKKLPATRASCATPSPCWSLFKAAKENCFEACEYCNYLSEGLAGEDSQLTHILTTSKGTPVFTASAKFGQQCWIEMCGKILSWRFDREIGLSKFWIASQAFPVLCLCL